MRNKNKITFPSSSGFSIPLPVPGQEWVETRYCFDVAIIILKMNVAPSQLQILCSYERS